MPGYDEDTTLFVYGSLLDEVQRVELLGRSVRVAPARLRDHAVGRARHFHITARAGAVAPGLLLLGLNASDFMALDAYEEVPILYSREKILVEDETGRPQRCWIYMPTSQVLRLTDVCD